MGHGFCYKCTKCGNEGQIMLGGGMASESFYCNSCGKGKSVSLTEIFEPHSKFYNTLHNLHPDSFIHPLLDEWRKNGVLGEDAKLLESYLCGLEKCLGNCLCGGRWSPIGKPSCPSCGATISEGAIKKDIKINWD